MVLKIEDKQLIVSEVAAVANKAIAAGLADYRGLTVVEMSALRAKARSEGIYLRVVRNTLARRALEGTEFACLQEALVGPVFVAFTDKEPGAVARLFQEILRNNDKLKVCALALAGKLFTADRLEMVASLPNREQALAIFLRTLKAPITKLAQTLAEPYAQLVRVMAAVGDQKRV